MSRARACRPALPPAIATVAIAAALAALLPAALPDVAHAQATPPSVPPIGNYTAGDGDGEFRSPEGVALYPNNTLVVADTGNHRVQVFAPNGTFLFKVGSEGTADGQFRSPAGVSIGNDDMFIVADTGNHRVQVFHSNGTHALTFGSEGTADGQFRSPAGADQGRQDFFAVADTGNHRVQTFYPNGTHALTFGERGNGPTIAGACASPAYAACNGTGEFESPMGVLSEDGNIWVADTGNHRIQNFNYLDSFNFIRPDGLQAPIGSYGDGAREFDGGPRSIDQGRGSRMIVADTGNHRVQQVAGGGTVFDFTFGSRGTGPGEFMAPEGASMNWFEKLAVADTGNHRVQVFHPNRTLHFILGLQGNGTDVAPPPTDGGNGDGGNGTDVAPPPTDGGNGDGGNGTDVAPPPTDGGNGDGGNGDGGNGTDVTPPTPTPTPTPTPDGGNGDGTDVTPPTPTPTPTPTPDGGNGDGTDVTPPTPTPTPTPTPDGGADVGTCSIELGSPSLDLRAVPGAASPAVRQVVSNTGLLDLTGIAIDATPWYVDPPAGTAPPYGTGRVATMPPSLTELAAATAGGGGAAVAPRTFAPLSADGTAPPATLPLAAGLPAGGEYGLWFRINLDGRSDLPAGGTLVQYTTFTAECPPPVPAP